MRRRHEATQGCPKANSTGTGRRENENFVILPGCVTYKGWTRPRPVTVFILEKDDSRNRAGKALQFFSAYDPIRVGGALPVMLYKGVWHQISKEFTIANAAPAIHDYDKQSSVSKGKGKSLPNTEDDIEESVQKAINLSIRESPLVPNAILPPRKGLLLDTSEMSTTTAPTETVAFTTVPPTKEECVK